MMYRIGDFSQICRISVRMLRHYDKLGLLTPDYVDGATGYRYYSIGQLADAHRILALRDLGMTLAQTGKLLQSSGTDDLLYGLLKAKRKDLVQHLAEEKARLDRIAARIGQIERVLDPVPYEVALKSMAVHRVMMVREQVPHVSAMGDVRDRLLRKLYGVLADCREEPGMELVIYHLQAYAEERIDMSMGVEVSGVIQAIPDSNLTVDRLPGATLAASIVYKGNLWGISHVVANLYKWLGMNRYTSVGPYHELHLSGRELELFAMDPPAEGIFEIIVPVKKL